MLENKLSPLVHSTSVFLLTHNVVSGVHILPPRDRYVNLMTLAKCARSGYCIDYMVTQPNTGTETWRPREDGHPLPCRSPSRGSATASPQRTACQGKTALPSSRVNDRGGSPCKNIYLSLFFFNIKRNGLERLTVVAVGRLIINENSCCGTPSQLLAD